MIAEAQLAVGLVIIADRCYKLALARGFKASARNDVEHAIGAVPQVGSVTAAIDLDRVDVAGIDLRADVAGDVGVGNGDAVDHPVQLMSAAHVQHVVGHVRARRVIGDHGERIGAVCTGRLLDFRAAHHGCGCYRIGRDGLRHGPDFSRLPDGSDLEGKVENLGTAGRDGEGLLHRGEAIAGNDDGVDAGRNRLDRKSAVGIAFNFKEEVGMNRAQDDFRSGNGSMGGIVDDALHLAKQGGVDQRRCTQQRQDRQNSSQHQWLLRKSSLL